MDGFVEFGAVHKFFFDPYVFRCIPDPASEYHLLFLATTSARCYDDFVYLMKTECSMFIDKIEFDYFNPNKIEE